MSVTLSRRHLIAGATALGAAASLPIGAASAATGNAPFDYDDPIGNMNATVKMMGSLDGSLTYGYVRGRLHGKRPSEHTIPLVDFEGCAARVFRRREDGFFDMGLREWLIFRDMETGAKQDSMINPFTQEEVRLPHFRGGGGLNHYFDTKGQGRDGQDDLASPLAPEVNDWRFQGDLAIVQIDKFIAFPNYQSPEKFPRASTGPVRREYQTQTLMGPRAVLEDPDAASVPTTEVWIMKNDWMGFMNMGQWTGGHIWRGVGQKFFDSGALPDQFVADTNATFPGLFEEVEGWAA